MSKTSDGDKATRRDFLKIAAASAPAAAAAAVVNSDEAEAATADDAEGLRDTAHTRAYYESARF